MKFWKWLCVAAGIGMIVIAGVSYTSHAGGEGASGVGGKESVQESPAGAAGKKFNF